MLHTIDSIPAGVLDITCHFMSDAFCLIYFAFLLQLLVPEDVTHAFLRFALDIIRDT
jgi:hypothetical protein